MIENGNAAQKASANFGLLRDFYFDSDLVQVKPDDPKIHALYAQTQATEPTSQAKHSSQRLKLK